MNDIAKKIVQRANALNVSVSSLCRDAGISRAWFEKMKKRTPVTLDAYLKITNRLDELEHGRNLTTANRTAKGSEKTEA